MVPTTVRLPSGLKAVAVTISCTSAQSTTLCSGMFHTLTCSRHILSLQAKARRPLSLLIVVHLPSALKAVANSSSWISARPPPSALSIPHMHQRHSYLISWILITLTYAFLLKIHAAGQ